MPGIAFSNTSARARTPRQNKKEKATNNADVEKGDKDKDRIANRVAARRRHRRSRGLNVISVLLFVLMVLMALLSALFVPAWNAPLKSNENTTINGEDAINANPHRPFLDLSTNTLRYSYSR
jgi:ABC-type Fe3+ transport system permease subunit